MNEARKAQRIVVPIDISDASEQAIPYARAIARPEDTIVLLHAIPIPEFYPTRLPTSVNVRDLQETLHEAARAYLDGLIARAQTPDDSRIIPLIVHGRPASEIVSQASSPDTALIVMTTAGRGAASRLALGSVADQVIRTAPTPVMLIRLQDDREMTTPVRIGRIVVPVDGSARSLRALPTAAMLAGRLARPIVLVQVRELDRLGAVYRAALTPEVYGEMIDDEQDMIRAMLEQSAAELRTQGIATSWNVLTGSTAPAIEDEVNADDIIVMASHGRSGVRRWLFGSVAERLVRTGPVPVVLVPSM